MEVVDSHLFTTDPAKFIQIKVEILKSLIKRFFFYTCFSNSILREKKKKKPKQKHHIEVNYELEKHNSKHESNIPAVLRKEL